MPTLYLTGYYIFICGMLILGHRGAVIPNAPFAENTLSAFAYALQHGDGFETDACLRADADVYLAHDPNDRAAQSAAPTLQQALDMLRHGKTINIELKGFSVVHAVLAVLKKNVAAREIDPAQVIVSSFDHAALAEFRRAMPQVKTGALVVNQSENGTKIFPDLMNSPVYRCLNAYNLRQSELRSVQPDFFIMPENMLTRDSINLIQLEFPVAQLCGWTVSEESAPNYMALAQRLKTLPPPKIGAMVVDEPKLFQQIWKEV